LSLLDCKARIVERVTHEHPMHELWPKESVESLLEEHDDWRQLSPHQQKFREKELDYADVAHYALGVKGKRMVEVSLVVSQVGFSCAYLIFIQENLTHYLPNVQQSMWLLLLLPALTGLCLYRNINSLSYFSIMADLANVFAYCIVFYFDFSHSTRVPMHPKTMTLQGLPFFLGVSIYCYEGAGLILVLESSVGESQRTQFRSIFKVVMLVVTTLYIAFGAAGYLSFGPATKPIITLNLPPGLFPHLVKACLCFSLFFTYPVMMFPVVQLLEDKFISDPQHHFHQGNILRGVLVGVTGLIVIAIPNFSVLMALVGSTCCTLLAFILPAILHLLLFESYVYLLSSIPILHS
jgi:proton-coupled amino acid transporter